MKPATEAELGAEALVIIRLWQHGWSQCVTAGEKAVCTATMHSLIDLVFDFDERTEEEAHG